MADPTDAPRLKIAYLCTTFPVHSETFLQREVRAMRQLPVDFEVFSLWAGHKEWEGIPIRRFRKLRLLELFWALPYWAWVNPRALCEALEALWSRPMPSPLNLAENFLGFGFALVFGRELRRKHYDICHAVWATAPGSAAWLLRKLLGVPYTMGAHAFDVFSCGGDWLLPEKLRDARLIHTTTEVTRRRLLSMGARPDKVALIRRGLDTLPECRARPQLHTPLRLLSVGRLVPKKGYFRQLEIYRALNDAGVAFEARIVGKGPLMRQLQARIHDLGLEDRVTLLGARRYSEIVELYNWADTFLFTGMVAPDGDRDGLPNVIPEAMAAGVPVITAPVSGTTEAIHHGETGLVVRLDDLAGWVKAIVRVRDDHALREGLRVQARAWVQREFNAHRNAARLAEAVRFAIGHKSDVRPGAGWV